LRGYCFLIPTVRNEEREKADQTEEWRGREREEKGRK
jgi:hypothetical protein